MPVDSPAETWRPSDRGDRGRSTPTSPGSTPAIASRSTTCRRPGSTARGCRPGRRQRLDSTAPPDDLAQHARQRLGAERRRARRQAVVMAWIDFRSYDWDVPRATSSGRRRHVRARRTRSTSRPKAIRVARGLAARGDRGDGPAGRVHGLAQVADSAHAPSSLYDIALHGFGDHSDKIDGTGTAHVNAFSPAVARRPRGALVAWQDMRRGVGDIRIARIGRRVTGTLAPDRRPRPGRATPGARRSPSSQARRSSPGRTTATARPRSTSAGCRYPSSRVARERRPPTK